MRGANTVTGQYASLVGIMLVLLCGGSTLRAQQPEQQPPAPAPMRQVEPQEPAMPQQQSAPQEQPPAAKPEPPSASESPAAPHHSPLDDLDDFEPAPKVSPPPAPAEIESLHALVGHPLVVSTPGRIQRISAAGPNIIDTITLNPNQILINAKALGRVSLVVGDATGLSQQFDISVDPEAPLALEDLVKTASAQPEVTKAETVWLEWAVFASLILAAGAILGARRRRRPRGSNLELAGRPAASPEGGQAGLAAVAPQPHVERPHKKATQVSQLSGETPAPRPGRANAKRNERWLETCLEAAVNGFFSAPSGAATGKTGAVPKRSSEGSSFGLPAAAHPHPLLETVTALAFAVEAKGPYARGHSQAVSRLAARIAIQAGLSAAEVEETRLAGLVHDIGKIRVPESVCNKPDRLTAEEYAMMSSHSAWGASMLEPLNVKTVERIVRHHHERFDGKGYPDGLAGDTIPVGARIVAVAESFHNMLCELPYKNARPFEDALAELRRCSGLQFDPKVVGAFLDWVRIYADSATHPGVA